MTSRCIRSTGSRTRLESSLRLCRPCFWLTATVPVVRATFSEPAALRGLLPPDYMHSQLHSQLHSQQPNQLPSQLLSQLHGRLHSQLQSELCAAVKLRPVDVGRGPYFSLSS